MRKRLTEILPGKARDVTLPPLTFGVRRRAVYNRAKSCTKLRSLWAIDRCRHCRRNSARDAKSKRNHECGNPVLSKLTEPLDSVETLILWFRSNLHQRDTGHAQIICARNGSGDFAVRRDLHTSQFRSGEIFRTAFAQADGQTIGNYSELRIV